MMESWLLERPVLVHALCAVTHHHVVESGGGLFFATYDDFAGAVIELLTKPELGSTMGRAGEEYVRNRYDWKVVLKRFDAVMSSFEGSVQLTMV